MPKLLDKKNVDMLTAHKIYTKTEIEARCEIMLDNYSKVINIEGLTMVDMAKKEILPAVEAYTADLAKAVAAKTAAVEGLGCEYEKSLIKKLSCLTDRIAAAADDLEGALVKLKTVDDVTETANADRDEILPKMGVLRAVADEAETLTAEKYWPFPTYGELLFGVR